MRIGFITQLLWSRYGDFWVHLLEGIGAEAVFAPPEKVRKHVHSEALRAIPGTFLQLAVAQALALDDVDVLVVPRLNAQEVPRGSGQDPWIADFPTTLASFANVPKIISVPVSVEHTESIAIEIMLSLSRDAAKVKRVWERNSHRAKPPRYPEVNWNKRPYQKEVLGFIGQPWMMSDQIMPLLNLPDSLIVAQHQLEPVFLRQESPKQKRLIETDAEVLGAARFFGRKGNIDRIVMLVDKISGADVWLEKQVEKIIHKPLEVIYLQDLVPQTNIAEILMIRP